jgi:hypothetical protein
VTGLSLVQRRCT